MGQFEAFIGVNFWTALLTLLNTLTIFLVGKKFLFGPVMKMIRDRQQEIDTMYADADSAKKNACNMEAEYSKKLELATQTGEQLVKEAVARGQNREEEIVRAAQAKASAMLDKAAADIALEKKQAINDAKDELSDMAVAIAAKVLRREINATDQADLVDSFIQELGESV